MFHNLSPFTAQIQGYQNTVYDSEWLCPTAVPFWKVLGFRLKIGKTAKIKNCGLHLSTKDNFYCFQ